MPKWNSVSIASSHSERTVKPGEENKTYQKLNMLKKKNKIPFTEARNIIETASSIPLYAKIKKSKNIHQDQTNYMKSNKRN